MQSRSDSGEAMTKQGVAPEDVLLGGGRRRKGVMVLWGPHVSELESGELDMKSEI